MLNDLSSFTRWVSALQATALGAILGAIVVPGVNDGAATSIVIMAVGLLLFIVAAVASATVPRRAQRRLVREISEASPAIVRGDVATAAVAGRIVRKRTVRSAAGFLASRPEPLDAPSCDVVATALAADGARRVAFLAPVQVARQFDRSPVALRLHPEFRDVAVLDDLVQRDQLAAIASDSRWTTETLPTDRSVAGGWGAVVGVWFVGIVAGCGVAAILAAVVA